MRRPVSQVRIIPNNVPESRVSAATSSLHVCVLLRLLSTRKWLAADPFTQPQLCALLALSSFLSHANTASLPFMLMPKHLSTSGLVRLDLDRKVCDRHLQRREFLRFECCNPFQSIYIKIFSKLMQDYL